MNLDKQIEEAAKALENSKVKPIKHHKFKIGDRVRYLGENTVVVSVSDEMINTSEEYIVEYSKGWRSEFSYDHDESSKQEHKYYHYSHELKLFLIEEESLIGRYVKCLRDGANSCQVDGKYVVKDNYYLLDSLEGYSYKLHNGNFCGRKGDTNSDFNLRGFELMPEGFIPKTDTKNYLDATVKDKWYPVVGEWVIVDNLDNGYAGTIGYKFQVGRIFGKNIYPTVHTLEKYVSFYDVSNLKSTNKFSTLTTADSWFSKIEDNIISAYTKPSFFDKTGTKKITQKDNISVNFVSKIVYPETIERNRKTDNLIILGLT